MQGISSPMLVIITETTVPREIVITITAAETKPEAINAKITNIVAIVIETSDLGSTKGMDIAATNNRTVATIEYISTVKPMANSRRLTSTVGARCRLCDVLVVFVAFWLLFFSNRTQGSSWLFIRRILDSKKLVGVILVRVGFDV